MRSFFYLFFWSVFEATWTPQNLDFGALAYTRCYFSLFRRSRFSFHFGFILEVFFDSKCYQKVIRKTLQKKSRNWTQKGFQKGPEGAPKTPQKPLKKQAWKNRKKRGSQVIRGRGPELNLAPSPSKPPPRLEESGRKNVQRGKGASRHPVNRKPGI